jgi:hypothetical protein
MQEEKVSLAHTPPAAVGLQPGDEGYVPPTDAVPLPSEGKIYPPEMSLHLEDSVLIRSMTATDEDIITSRGLLKEGKAITALLRSCLVDKSIDPDDMVAGDRNAICTAIRITGYGRRYQPQIECPRCEKVGEGDFDLALMEVKRLGADPISPGANAFRYVLPVTKKEVVFKILTGKDENELSETIENAKKLSDIGLERGVTLRLFHAILSVGGVDDRIRIERFVRHMPALDSRALRAYVDKISPGVEMRQRYKCEDCKAETEVEVPMTTEFFWPTRGWEG